MQFLSNKERRAFNKKWNVKCKVVKEVPLKSCLVYECDGKVLVIKKGNVEFPFIEYVNKPYVVVDNGALPFILKGADVMRPGIVELDEFNRGEIVAVKNMKGLTIAVGIALFSSEEMKSMEKGKVIETLHYIKDEVWKYAKHSNHNA